MPAIAQVPSSLVVVVTVGGSCAVATRSAVDGTLPMTLRAARRPEAVCSSVPGAGAAFWAAGWVRLVGPRMTVTPPGSGPVTRPRRLTSWGVPGVPEPGWAPPVSPLSPPDGAVLAAPPPAAAPVAGGCSVPDVCSGPDDCSVPGAAAPPAGCPVPGAAAPPDSPPGAAPPVSPPGAAPPDSPPGAAPPPGAA